MICRLFALVFGLILLCPANDAHSHALEPGYLEIVPTQRGDWQVTWRKPAVGGRPLGIDAVLPDICAPRQSGPMRFDGSAYVVGWIATCTAPIQAGEIFIDGLGEVATEVLLRFVPEPGASATTLRLTPDNPSLQLPAVATPLTVLSSYFALGFDHILGGIDHLLFVLALMLLVPTLRMLFWTITAFTVSHSLTLALSAMGWVSLPMPPVEAVIALSVVFMAAEILKRGSGQTTLIQRAPWVVAFAFGLLHGLGFASALREIGLPDADIAIALVAFNLGVEAGQLAFVAVVLAVALCARFVVRRFRDRPLALETHIATGLAYVIGSTAAFWTVERVVAFFG